MLTLQKDKNLKIASITASDKSIDELLTREWLLTNECGSYASSTVVGCNTSGYHGLLVGSLDPPADRIMALANCLETVICNELAPSAGSGQALSGVEGKTFNLSTFEFGDKFAPAGFSHIKRFRQDIGVHFDYEMAVDLAKIKLTKSVYLLRQTDTVAVVYNFTKIKKPVEFILRPFVGLRDFHTLQKSCAPIHSNWIGEGLRINYDAPGSCELFLYCPSMNFEKDQQWWYNFVYRSSRERGQDFTEDLWTPGFFKCRIESPTELVLWANLSRAAAYNKIEQLDIGDITAVREDLHSHQNEVITVANVDDQNLKLLCLAADQFIVKCRKDRNYQTTILAGFPWFLDWGRDAFIALPGLLLLTGRFDEAKSVLTTFAQAADNGMIPNRFDDRSGAAHFNSVDASLWFINAAFQYFQSTGDSKTFTQEFLPVIRWIIDSYQKGTRFDIYADADGLITAGNDNTQLTWMDAKCDGVAITARFGKAVEINALWYNSLCLLAQFYLRRNSENAKQYRSMAQIVGASFCQLFWNEAVGYLNDCILPGGLADAGLRPNQIFAVSLTFSPPLSLQQQKSIVDVVQKELLTPYGLRTLNIQNPNYKGTYTGPQRQRDEAYHQGTVWPYLMGPFVEAYLKVNKFSRKSKKTAADFIKPLMRHLTEDACLGQVSEIFDGNVPHKPKGCFAQAWSVAELLRAYYMINS